MKTNSHGSTCPALIIVACIASADPVLASTGCPGDDTNSTLAAEYLFFEGAGATALNTGIDGDDGNATLTNGASFNTDVPPPNANCGWSVDIPDSGSGSTTPAVETDPTYDPLAGVSNFTIMAWIRRQSSSRNISQKR